MIWRYRLDPPADGRVQMQRDQIQYSQFQLHDLPLLRFYTWSQPTLSIGRFQTLSVELEQRLAALQIPVVRRPTGGQAILHEGDLTFSLVAPHVEPLKGSVMTSYAHFAEGVIAGLRYLGLQASTVTHEAGQVNLAQCDQHKPDNCLNQLTAADIRLGHQKLLGAAQVRCRKALLIQAVIYRHCNQERMQALFGAHAENTDLASHLSLMPSIERLAEVICEGFRQRWQICFKPVKADYASAFGPHVVD